MTDVGVVVFPGATKLDLPPDRLLEAALGKLKSVVIIGFTKEGEEWFSSSKADGAFPVYCFARATHKLMKIADDD